MMLRVSKQRAPVVWAAMVSETLVAKAIDMRTVRPSVHAGMYRGVIPGASTMTRHCATINDRDRALRRLLLIARRSQKAS